jgi:hypothetical protein
MRKRALLIILGLAFFLATGFAVYAAPNITASLTANPPSFVGKCPAVITFNGQITSSAPGRVQYKFIRSDGANAPVQTLEFAQPGSMPVSTTWTLGGPGLPTYAGWEAIQVIYPQQVQSNKAEFNVQCQQASQLRITARLAANPVSYSGNCPAVIKFEGEISVSAPCTVQYKFLRSDGATDTIMKSLVFEGPGSKPVSTTWTLGGPGLPNYAGWEAIDVIAPVHVESNKAVFKMQCQAAGQQRITARLAAIPTSYSGNCPAVIKFEGVISASAPCTVQYKFLRSDNATDTIMKSLVFEGPGTKPVSTTWTLGGPSLPSYEGWEAIQVISPVTVESNKAAFKMQCVGGQQPQQPQQPTVGREDCISFNPATTEVKQIEGDWKIVDGSHWMFSFGSKKDEADQALAIIKKYGFNHTCFVGRPGPSFKYLRK